MGAIDQGITQMCCSSSGGKMSGNICISNWSSSGFGNCCKATGAYYGGCFNFLWNFYALCHKIYCYKIYCYKNLLYNNILPLHDLFNYMIYFSFLLVIVLSAVISLLYVLIVMIWSNK